MEAELRELDPAEAEEYLQSLGASEGGLTSLISAAYRQLGLLTYFTTGACPSIPSVCVSSMGSRLALTNEGKIALKPWHYTHSVPHDCQVQHHMYNLKEASAS